MGESGRRWWTWPLAMGVVGCGDGESAGRGGVDGKGWVSIGSGAGSGSACDISTAASSSAPTSLDGFFFLPFFTVLGFSVGSGSSSNSGVGAGFDFDFAFDTGAVATGAGVATSHSSSDSATARALDFDLVSFALGFDFDFGFGAITDPAFDTAPRVDRLLLGSPSPSSTAAAPLAFEVGAVVVDAKKGQSTPDFPLRFSCSCLYIIKV